MAAKLGYFPTKPNIGHKKKASHRAERGF